MTPELQRLIDDYGNAQFACGVWRADDDELWDDVVGEAIAARAALVAYLSPRLDAPASVGEVQHG